jgi:hypothetical protein
MNHRSRNVSRFLLLAVAAGLCAPLQAQVHYHDSGGPWNQRASRGPDAEVDGWYYNLGVTGIRVMLMEDAPKHLLVKYVFAGTPAAKRVKVGDVLIGVGGQRFETEHRHGYGMDVFGPDGPLLDFAIALEESQKKGRGKLEISLTREGKERSVSLPVGTKYGTYGRSFPEECSKTDRILGDLYEFLLEHQRDDGSWGSPPQDTFAPLALLASGNQKHRQAVKRNVQFHARTTQSEDESGLINWRYMAAAIVMSEYYLATKERWVLTELDEVYQFLLSSQYTDMSQVAPTVKDSHPDDVPKTAMRAHGGWGHNPGFEGYGPISMLTGQGALAFALMKHCGVQVDRERHDFAYDFLARGTGRNGYLWYADEAAGQSDWADMGRTGAAGIANAMSPYRGKEYRNRALDHATVIGEHPESFPDTHGSPILGMGYAALAANTDKASFRQLMDASKWWFVLSRCADGSFYYQPNRDNAGYGSDSRIGATAVTALILSIGKHSLHVTGKPFKR